MNHDTIDIKIYYEDTDAGAVVYYANYLRYLERGRTEYLAARGLSVAGLHSDGVVFVVVHVDIRYLRPGRLGDILSIDTSVAEVRNASLTFSQKVRRGDEPIAEANVTLACTDPSGRPMRLPDALRNLQSP